jgi:hypothetical protein
MPEELEQPEVIPEAYLDTEGSDVLLQREQDANLTIWQLTSQDIFLELEHDLRGEVFNEKTKKWEQKKGGKRLMTEEGIRTVMSVVRSKVNKNTFLSNLTDDDIAIIMKDLCLSITTLLYEKYEEFEIDTVFLELIHDKIVHFTFFALKRALNQGERLFLGRSQQTRETIIRDERAEKGGFLGGLFGGK